MAGACCLSFAHLFSFQVCYADLPPASTLPSPPAAAGTKMLMDAASLAMGFVKKKLAGANDRAGDIVLKRGIFEVDFTAGLLTLADKDKAIAVKPQIGNECWDITTQSRAEKQTLNHLLECISRKLSLEQTIETGKDKGLIGIDKTVIKAGVLNRKAKTVYKVDERFIVLIPGKLLLFKGPDISSKRVRYVTTLGRARIEATHGQPSFQLLVPNTKALSLTASSADAAKEWISALEDSIEYANNQGAGNPSKRAAAQSNQGRPQQFDNGFMIPNSNRLQNLHLSDWSAASIDPVRSAGPITQQIYCQPGADQLNGSRQQSYMDKGPYYQQYSAAESSTGMQACEKTDSSEYPRQNPRLMRNSFETNQAGSQDYLARVAPYPASGVHNDRNPFSRNIYSSYAGGPSNMFAAPQNMSSGFARSQDACDRRDADATTVGGMRVGYFSQGGPYRDPNFRTDPLSSNQQRCPTANPDVEYANAKPQFDCHRNPIFYSHPLGGTSDGFHGSPISGHECSPSNNYHPNVNYGGFGGHPSDCTQFDNGGWELNNRGFCNGSQGNYASRTSRQQYNSTQASNRNKATYDPWASRTDTKDSDSD